MNNVLKRTFQLLSVGSLTLTSCMMYGVPVDYKQKAIKVQTENNLPIIRSISKTYSKPRHPTNKIYKYRRFYFF